MLFQCWASVADAGPTLKQHWPSVSFQLGRRTHGVLFSWPLLISHHVHIWPEIFSGEQFRATLEVKRRISNRRHLITRKGGQLEILNCIHYLLHFLSAELYFFALCLKAKYLFNYLSFFILSTKVDPKLGLVLI